MALEGNFENWSGLNAWTKHSKASGKVKSSSVEDPIYFGNK